MIGLAAGAIYLVVLPIGHVAALRSASLVLAFAAAIVFWVRPDRRLLPVFAAFAAWLTAACLSLLSTRDFAASLQAIENEVLRSLMVFLTFYVLTRRLHAYPVWLVATALGFGVLSAFAVQSFFVHGEWAFYYVPPLGDYATSAVIVLPLLAGHLAFMREGWATTLLLVIAVAMTFSAGYLTMSRGFWLAVICAALLAVTLNVLRTGRIKRRSLVLVGAVSIAALAIAVLVSLQRGRPLLYLYDRAVIYSTVVAKISANPVTGTGYGHETDKVWYAAAFPDRAIFHAHNLVLSYLDQMGIPGALALIMIFGAPAWLFWRVLRTASSEAGVAALCGLVLIACVFVKNNLDFFFWKHNLWLFFAHLGIYFGEIDRSLSRPSHASR